MDKPIFIVGAPRSGTTLTAKILGLHPRIFMPGETHFFDDIYSRRDEYGDPPNNNSIEKIIERLRTIYARYNEPDDQERVAALFEDETVQLAYRLKSCDSYENIFSLFMESQANQLGKFRWGNNTPRDLFHIDSIMAFYPEAKIVVCVRDVRDFLLSYKYKWRNTRGDNEERLKRLYHPVVTSLLWKASMRRVLAIGKNVHEKNTVVIHYEDLVTQPVQVMQKICDAIDEKFDSQMIAVKANNSSNLGQQEGIYTSSKGLWRRDLNPEEAWIAQFIARKELKNLGYSIEKININYIKIALIFIGFPFALVRGIYANRDKRGPLLPYIGRRLSSFFQKN